MREGRRLDRTYVEPLRMSSRSNGFWLVLMMFFGAILIALTKGVTAIVCIFEKNENSHRLPLVSSFIPYYVTKTQPMTLLIIVSIIYQILHEQYQKLCYVCVINVN